MRSDQNWIEDYLAGKLSPAEQRELENRIAEDEGLAQAFREAAHIYAATKIDARRQLQSDLKAALLDNDLNQNAPVKSLQMRPWIWAAAAVVILGLSYFLLRPNEATPENLFASYYSAPPTLSMRQDSKLAAWESAMAAYTKGDFEIAQAELLIIKADSSFERPSALALYLGITYLEAGEADNALKVLAEIGPTSLYSPHRSWYSALAQLKANRLTEAKSLLTEISQTEGHFKQAEAKLLLEEEALTNY